MNVGVSVIIPTVGRESLSRAVLSVLSQTHPFLEVILVLNGPNELPISVPSDPRIVVRRCVNSGVSAARNLGVQNASHSWIAFLDDDDEWLPNKIEEQLNVALSRPNTVISCRAFVNRDGKTTTRPEVKDTVFCSSDFLGNYYRRLSWLPSRSYVATSSILAPKAACLKIAFDEDLEAREDLWWYHQMVSSGSDFLQISLPLVSISTSSTRAITRDTNGAIEQWFRRISYINIRYGRNFLLGSQLRDSILGGQWSRISVLLRLSLNTLFRKSTKLRLNK